MDVHVQTDAALSSRVTGSDQEINNGTKNEVVKLHLNSTVSSHK